MRAPTSTYRLQLTADFTLGDAAGLVPYLSALGVGAVYLSPVLQATEGSTHGYDVTDPTRIDVERGGESGWRALVEATRSHGLGLVVDIVPNHLGVAVPAENPAWWSVLRLGQDSPYANWFDIDWESGPLLLPVLGEDSLTDLELHPTDEGGELRYYEHRFPLAPDSWAPGDSLTTVLDRQAYRLVDWRRGDSELNYRRFFTITSLAGLRQEDPDVFSETHALIGTWVRQAEISGLRVDHPDGLADPRNYFERLHSLAPQAWTVAEKILEPGERLPDWEVSGTTGYDALNEFTGVLINSGAAPEFDRMYRELTGDRRGAIAHVREDKERAASSLLRAEVNRMCRLVHDHPADQVAQVLIDLAVEFPTYRSYLPEAGESLQQAAENVDHPLLAALLVRLQDPEDELARRFQQLTGAVMAKGTEDTAFYRYGRFVALNEVGGDASHFGLTPSEFHHRQAERQQHWPEAMTALSTHDTKRSEDVRARLAVLSEMPQQWRRFAEAFLAAADFDDRPLAYLLAQVAVGMDPQPGDTDARGRLRAYAEKAMREAAVHTSWTDQDADFEAAVLRLVDHLFDDADLTDAFSRLQTLVEQPAWCNALAQKLLQVSGPGIPDVYQGTELWDDSLVDPDNRRPVDFAARAGMLAELMSAPAVDDSGAAKLWVTRQALHLRRDRPDLFTGYTPLAATGTASDHLLAFDRGGAITAVTRLPWTLAEDGGWRETTLELPAGTWGDVLSARTHSGTVPATELFGSLPVALLVRE
ncbi:malto-oligosyltrehalose synthase [Naumannella halotolerans]|uniref:(1->4)-alpha-D-glucan 1-alpha-D-glucosylmutase n=1 Tax=Naumannella halotolerans TaxID=993414 RepID=A0A4R7JAH7_9ACTN|nr:malto-oligosyltrehalose synthase [Naumannella halotolerans]TDT34344.1 (1->4)-alpha-D-glucan 1-alpha-D-glucosylmutase [Naumannella halotolerans]